MGGENGVLASQPAGGCGKIAGLMMLVVHFFESSMVLLMLTTGTYCRKKAETSEKETKFVRLQKRLRFLF
jgi:hypothetical protein